MGHQTLFVMFLMEAADFFSILLSPFCRWG